MPPPKMIYLASPYSDDNPAVMEERAQETTEFVARMTALGHLIYSPITYYHTIAQVMSLPTDAEFWWGFNRDMLNRCHEMYVLEIDGWSASVGVDKEIEYCKLIGKTYHFIQTDGVMVP